MLSLFSLFQSTLFPRSGQLLQGYLQPYLYTRFLCIYGNDRAHVLNQETPFRDPILHRKLSYRIRPNFRSFWYHNTRGIFRPVMKIGIIQNSPVLFVQIGVKARSTMGLSVYGFLIPHQISVREVDEVPVVDIVKMSALHTHLPQQRNSTLSNGVSAFELDLLMRRISSSDKHLNSTIFQLHIEQQQPLKRCFISPL